MSRLAIAMVVVIVVPTVVVIARLVDALMNMVSAFRRTE